MEELRNTLRSVSGEGFTHTPTGKKKKIATKTLVAILEIADA